MRGPGEEQQETGRDGHLLAKRYLEATTRVTLPYVVNKWPRQCTFELLKGVKGWDLFGHLVGDKGEPGPELAVESKRYSSDGNQGSLYRDYLVNCYSATARMLKTNDRQMEFMWVTWHPFLVSTWNELCTSQAILSAVEERRQTIDQLANAGNWEQLKKLDVLGDHTPDRATAEVLAPRLWLVVFSGRQKDLIMSRRSVDVLRLQLATEGGDE